MVLAVNINKGGSAYKLAQKYDISQAAIEYYKNIKRPEIDRVKFTEIETREIQDYINRRKITKKELAEEMLRPVSSINRKIGAEKAKITKSFG